jgi:glycosyltransferase involved in cell wall biosynthesis
MMAERLRDRHRHVRFIPCGVDGEHFSRPDPVEVERTRAAIDALFQAQVPTRMQASSADNAAGPLAGYFGFLNDRVETTLVRALLDEGWRVLLIGPSSSTMPPLPMHPGLIYVGLKPYASLPSHLALMDLAIIPYRTDGAHRFLYPVKALEYLAGGKPVLSTSLPDVKRFLGDYVLLADGPAAWGAIARDWERIENDALEKARAGQRYALSRGWDAMVSEMGEELEQRKPEA